MEYGQVLTGWQTDTTVPLVAVDDQRRASSTAAAFFQGIANVLAGTDNPPRTTDAVTFTTGQERFEGIPGYGQPIDGLNFGVTPDGRIYVQGQASTAAGTVPVSQAPRTAAPAAAASTSMLLLLGLAFLLLRK